MLAINALDTSNKFIHLGNLEFYPTDVALSTLIET
jgi:hypothetical protein